VARPQQRGLARVRKTHQADVGEQLQLQRERALLAGRPALERRLGMLGGTFDPPHLAHLVLAAAAHHHLGLERVLFVPAGDPWRKRGRAALSPAWARLRLVRAAVERLPWAEVSEVETGRAGPSYTADTLGLLRREAPGAWWFLLGADALADLPQWHEPQRISAQARLGVARRPGPNGDAAVDPAVREAVPGIERRIDWIPMPALAVSSSELRERVRHGRDVSLLIPERVREEIEALGLYR